MISSREELEKAIRVKRELERREEERYPALRYARKFHQNTRGQPMEFHNRQYLLTMYKAFPAPSALGPDGLDIVIKKCVQMGVSELLLCATLAYAGEYGRAVMYVLPKFDLKFTFTSNRIDKPINRVPYYQAKLREQYKGSRTKGLKDFGRGVIKVVGSNVETEFVEYPADVVFIDEADQCDQGKIPIARDRLKGPGSLRIHVLNGNPTIETGGLHDAFMNSNRMEWYVDCTACGEPQELRFFGNVMAPPTGANAATVSTDWGLWTLRDREWHPNIGRDIQIYCRHCGQKMDRTARGRWWEENPGARTIGFHLSKVMDPTYPLHSLYDTFLKGKKNETAMQLFFNYDLGIAYTAHNAQLTKSMLRACIGKHRTMASAPPNVECVMGIDVGTVLHYWIETRRRPGEKPRLLRADYCTSFEELHRLIRTYNVVSTVIDARPETRKSFEFVKEFPRGHAWRCDYDYHGLKDPKRDWRERLIKADRTISMDESHGEFAAQEIELPEDFMSLHRGEVVEQMVSSVRVKETRPNGSEIYVWDSKGSADHYRHAKNYASLAQEMFTPPATGIKV